MQEQLAAAHAEIFIKQTSDWFKKLIQKEELVGDLYSINYETARVIIHDTYRSKVGGIPSLSFLIATRIDPDKDNISHLEEDSSIILLRVMDSAPLPQDTEAERIRVETAQRVSGESAKHWDDPQTMDTRTRVYLGYAGVECRIIGTFFLEEDSEVPESPLCLRFGSDISNYYPNRGLKVYKPNGEALEQIVNYCDPLRLKDHEVKFGTTNSIKLGCVRYASTNRKHQKIDDVPVNIYPADLISQKTALFGMTRTGKSNTTKIIAKSVYELRQHQNSLDGTNRIGQIVFDPNGEYANENTQDNNSALKNVWKYNLTMLKEYNDLINRFQNEADNNKKEEILKETKDLLEREVITYGLLPHNADPFRRLMKINFFEEANLQIGKEIIDMYIADQNAQYIKNFRNVSFIKPQEKDYNESEFNSQLTRYNRRVLVYNALLNKAGFEPPNSKVDIRKLFRKELLELMCEYSEKKISKKVQLIQAAGYTLSSDTVSWDSLYAAFEGLFYFISTAAFNEFNKKYITQKSNEDIEDSCGEGWADAELEALLEMFAHGKAVGLLGGVKIQHTTTTGSDYAKDIYDELKKGKLVIIDQSSGEPELNKSSANRIMWQIFRENQKEFRNGEKNIPEILVYVEEAHNLLPAGSDMDLSDVWVRTAKEGAKYRIGMVYATQEVSSIQKNILKNTANWFISHLNNTDETKELCKYYDFADFEPSIRRAQDKGFVRVKTLSNLFVVPVQVDKFEIPEQ